MGFCPNCRDEFQEWVKVCPDCKVALVQKLPEEQVAHISDKRRTARDRIVTVAACFHPEEAYLVSAKLKAAGIPSFVADEHMTGIYYLSPVATQGSRVQVFESDAAEAKKIIDEGKRTNRRSSKTHISCPHCQSNDIRYCYSIRDLFVLVVTTLSGSAFPFLKRKYKCNICGHSWEGEDKDLPSQTNSQS